MAQHEDRKSELRNRNPFGRALVGHIQAVTAATRLRALRTRIRHLRDRRRPIVLMYHRVADIVVDPWNLAVGPERFAEQIAVLARRREIVPLERIGERPAGKPLAAITFDDGYVDVLTHALPVLESHGAPATVFVTTGQMGSPREFWWDELTRILLETRPRREVAFAVPGSHRQFHVGLHDDEAFRRRTHRAVWGLIRLMPATERANVLQALAGMFDVDLAARPANRCMTRAEIAALRGTCLSVGAHSRTHSSLYTLDRAGQQDEIFGSRDDCAALTGAPPAAFAYPFGDVDETAVTLVREAGFAQAVTVDNGAVRKGGDPLRLPRINVLDWSGAEFARNVP